MPEGRNEKIILYMHAGSGNHGCEAIANALSGLIPGQKILISYYAKEDKKYSLKDRYDIVQERSFDDHKIMHVLYAVYRLMTKDRESFIRYRFKEYLAKGNRKHIDPATGINTEYPVAISIGGDNYCYDIMLNDLRLTNSAFNAQGSKTVLLGCSIEPEVLNDRNIVKDLSGYHTIIARESITFDALNECFAKEENRPEIRFIPDPAFVLETKKPDDPESLIVSPGNEKAFGENGSFTKDFVGINISPMIKDNEKVVGITAKNYEKLIEYVIEKTDMNVILIPHVVWARNDDRKSIDELFEKYKDTGRVFKAEDTECRELKYLISKCRFFVGARTHSTIAAYSSCVPTLVVGYSVKAKGIAKDLFDTEDISNYVLPVQSLSTEDQLTNAFKWLFDNEKSIRDHLEQIIPEYINKTNEYSEVIASITPERG
ncbi:MAG: polysaccharide pyruvyl transferase family protein [Lachnospiraceae bacterium]|nr:polysaccharide pyruvyl transferase family protein [Lachnospiraceae bacterium]